MRLIFCRDLVILVILVWIRAGADIRVEIHMAACGCKVENEAETKAENSRILAVVNNMSIVL